MLEPHFQPQRSAVGGFNARIAYAKHSVEGRLTLPGPHLWRVGRRTILKAERDSIAEGGSARFTAEDANAGA